MPPINLGWNTMTVEHQGLTFERLGHASVRIETSDGTVLSIDPWDEILDEPASDAEYVFVTHDDHDHYDPAAIATVARGDAEVIAYEAIDTRDLDLPVTTVEYDAARTVGGIEIETVPAYNRPDGTHIDETGKPYHAEGEVVGFRLTIDGVVVYFPSDTDYLDEHEGITADVFIPPIGGHYTMDRHEAADFAQNVEPDLVLPVHYDTFDEIETDAEAFADELTADGLRVELF